MRKIIKLLLVIFIFFIGVKVNALSLDCTKTLRQNSYGVNVKTLQKLLNYTMGCGLDADGVFGTKTKSCTLSFQKKYSLQQDAIVGKNTCTKLNSVYKSIKSNKLIITGDVVNLRSGAGTNYKILTQVKRGQVYNIISSKKNGSKTWYKIKANSKTGYVISDYSTKTFIVLSINDQNLKYYSNGTLKLNTTVVTGNKGNHDTPKGKYTYDPSNKKYATYLRGYNDDGSRYNSYVDYWMPFILNRGIGFHDASWRSSFGNKIYQGNGSHGCVNMMHNDAKYLFNNVTTKTTVIVK